MTIKRKESFQATFQHNGQSRVVNVTSAASKEGVAVGAGNVLLGGVIGIAVDAGTGANLDHFPNPVHADFTKPANQSQAIALAHAKKVKSGQADGASSASVASNTPSSQTETVVVADNKDKATNAADAARSQTKENGLSRP